MWRRGSANCRGAFVRKGMLVFATKIVTGAMACSVVMAALLVASIRAEPKSETNVTAELTVERATAFARLALKGIRREYPNKPSNVMIDSTSVRSPRELHPAFYGCFDWHSSVHGHYLLVCVLRTFPKAPVATEIERALDTSFTKEKLAAEAAYFREPHNAAFERMYGWTWALKLAQELRTWSDPRAKRWAAHLKPLEDIIVSRAMAFLPKLRGPVRSGVHVDSAFALAWMLDYARAVDNEPFETLIVRVSKRLYERDVRYPVAYEPSAFDFFSSGLNEADLMRRVLVPKAYATWLGGFLPDLERSGLGPLATPAVVDHPEDGHLVHQAGLNLSRAWTMRGIASVLPKTDERRAALMTRVDAHIRAGLTYVTSGHYEGEHWLATFAWVAMIDAR